MESGGCKWRSSHLWLTHLVTDLLIHLISIKQHFGLQLSCLLLDLQVFTVRQDSRLQLHDKGPWLLQYSHTTKAREEPEPHFTPILVSLWAPICSSLPSLSACLPRGLLAPTAAI